MFELGEHQVVGRHFARGAAVSIKTEKGGLE
jgi:hypothetical protein